MNHEVEVELMKRETIEDIVNKMLEAAKKSPFVNSLDLVFFATHITAAYHESAKYQTKLLEEYRAENARLKAALANAKTIICNWCKSNWRCCPNGSEDKCEVIGEINGLLSVNAVDDSVNGHKVAFDDIEWELSTIKKENDE